MPISPPPPQPYIKKSRVEYHGISVGDDFANKSECMYSIGVKSLRESFQCDVIKSCSNSPKGKKLCGIFWKACKAYIAEDFDKAISELRGHRPIVVRKLEEAGFKKWSRAYCPRSRYNYMTSNSVESINSLTRIVHKVPITMLVEYYRNLLQMWYCEKQHRYEEAPENKLCDWAAAKVYDKMLKSANWTVRPIDHFKLFQVFNKLEVHQVDLVAFQCSCRKWKLFGLPCGHVCDICRPNQRRKSVCTNSLIRTPAREEHLSEEARLDKERLGNGRVYMDWNDVQASEEPVTTTEGMSVEDWQAVQGRLNSYNMYINFLSHVENDNYYQSQPECSIQSNDHKSHPESCINYHFFYLDDM
ncbi:transposase, MuDR, MULE transposase domain protein [Tanacetum coccineum]